MVPTPNATMIRHQSSLSTASTTWEDEMGSSAEQLFFVTSYSDFDKLAHGPRGTEAKHSVHVYRFHPHDGSMLLLNAHGKPDRLENPAFTVHHPRLPVVYTCTENIYDNGRIVAYRIGADGALSELGSVDAGGTSTCYMNISRDQKFILAVNYWDSTLVVIPLDFETGNFSGPIQNTYDPKDGKGVVSAGRTSGGVNHSDNDAETIKTRQADPHSHCLELDPYEGTIAYVPCLGKDLIREFYFDRQKGEIGFEMCTSPSGLDYGMPNGPRYVEFHPTLPIAYVINEFSATIGVFEINQDSLKEMAQASTEGQDMTQYQGRSTLRLIQSIKTIPSAFPVELTTCSRICVHKSGRFVLVGNRGHDSIAIFKVTQKGTKRGELKCISYFHTGGETPRHFEFDASGQWLLVANQDTNSIAVFNFNLSSGAITFTGKEYGVPSPNYVCCCPMGGDEIFIGRSNEMEVSIHAGVEEDAGSESDHSTVPTEMPSQKDLIEELKRAREEIASLKEQLNAKA